MSYIDEGYNEFLEQTEGGFSETTGNVMSPLDFDSAISDTSIGTAKIDTLSADKIITGTLSARTTISIGSSNIVLDGPNKRIVINDGEDDRVILGFLPGGF